MCRSTFTRAWLLEKRRCVRELASCKLTDALETPDAPEWEELLEALRRHQAREQYADHVSLLEAMVTIHRLTDNAEAAVKNLASMDWKA